MKIEQFLQGFAIYAVISILLTVWLVKILKSIKKDNDKWPDDMA